MKIADRIAKLETRRSGRQSPRVVMRHVIEGSTQADSEAQAAAFAAAHDPRTLHIFRMVVEAAHV